MPIDFYDILEVQEDATQEEIKRAYRLRVKEYHPDLNDHPRAHAQFKVIKKARDVLGDPSERSAYDRLGHREYVEKRLHGELPTMDFPRVSSSRNASSSSTTSSVNKGHTAHANGGTSTTRRATIGQRRQRSHRRSSTTSPTQNDRLIRHIWVAVVIGIVSYIGGISWFIVTNVTNIDIASIRASITATTQQPNTAVSLWATERFGVPTMTGVVEQFLTGTISLSSIGIVLGIILFPLCVGGTLSIIRRRTTWQPNYLYLVGSLGPVAGVIAHLVGITVLPLDMLLFIVIPIGTALIFLINRFR